MYKMPGAPTPASVAAMRANAQLGAVNTSKKYQWTTPYYTHSKDANNQDVYTLNGGVSNDFPIVTVPKDSYDDVANIKHQYAQAKAVGENWVVPFEQSDAQFLMRKRDAEEKAEFDSWVMNRYDTTDPAQVLMLQRIAPELFTRREEVINSTQELVSRYAKLRLRGPQTISDLELEWLVETGRLDLPQGPVWDPLKWREKQTGADDVQGEALKAGMDDKWNAQRYRDGLFSPLKWLTEETAAWNRNPKNKADIRGDPKDKYLNPRVPYPKKEFGNYWASPAPYPYAGGNTMGDPGEAVGGNDGPYPWAY